jgi:hypothetical protein
MIVSGDKVIFLDPSRSYLPFSGRASASMTLADIRRQISQSLIQHCLSTDLCSQAVSGPSSSTVQPVRFLFGFELLPWRKFSVDTLKLNTYDNEPLDPLPASVEEWPKPSVSPFFHNARLEGTC